MRNNLSKADDYNTFGTLEGLRLGDFCSVTEFSEHFSIPEYTVRRWLKDGALPGIKLGRMWRIHKTTVAKIETGELVINEGPADDDTDTDTDADTDTDTE